MFSKITDSIKNSLFVDDGADAKPAAIPTQGQPAPLAANGQATHGAAVLASDPRSSPFYAALRNATMNRITAYSSLMLASEKLATIIPDPVQRLRAAQATSNDGRSAQQVAEAVSIHLADIDAETMRFKATIEKKRNEIVGSLNNKKANAELLITSSAQELERLNARMQELHQTVAKAQSDVTAVASEIVAAEAELNNSMNDFTGAANTLREELNLGKNTILSSLA